MTVLICFEHHFLQFGEQFYCRQLSPAFLRRYREVWERVHIFARVSKQTSPPPNLPPMDTEGVEFIALPDYLGVAGYFRARRQIQEIGRAAIQNTDSILFRAPGIISTAVWKLIRGTGRPYGMEIIGDPHEAFAKGAIRHPLRPLIRWKLTRDLRNQCREAYAIGYVTRDTLQKRYPAGPGRFTTSYSDVELDAHTILDQPRRFDSAPSRPRLIMVGTFSQMYKGHDTLLHALADMKALGAGFEVTFIGDGKHRSEMQALAAGLQLSNSVAFLGELPAGDAIRANLDRADLFVMPSRTEGLPRAMIEAMARGLPCIGSRVGGIPELLAPDDLVPPSDPKALRIKLTEVLSNPNRLTEMSARNLEATQQYRSDLMQQRRREFYEQLRCASTGGDRAPNSDRTHSNAGLTR
jgi:glycosyltransferase involved in cell wall biosynthesis